MIPEQRIHEGPDSPHVKADPVEWYRGEWLLKERENERLYFLLFVFPLVTFLLGLWVG
jgi:hypothetical protein